jgi:hypothetical protein
MNGGFGKTTSDPTFNTEDCEKREAEYLVVV